MRDESTTVDVPTLERETFGKYELLERLGRGGMADVWRARMDGPSGFARTVVLKRILPHLVADEKARLLFEREARVVSRLSHAHIVQVFEFGDVKGEYYLAMELVDGQDVASLIRAGHITPAAAAFITRDVCRALSYAYNVRNDDGSPLHILHRDVSPSNIMVGYDGGVRLLDFGIAKALSDPRDKRTVKGTIRGKFGYIPPEIIEGLEPDQRADVFSAGVVLHEMLTGRRLFRGGSDLETLALVRKSKIPLPSSQNAKVTPALDDICMRALSRDRNQRFSSGTDVADLLDDVVHELRFGPTQMSELVGRMHPSVEASIPHKVVPVSSGPNTVREDARDTGRSVDLEDAVRGIERATERMSTRDIAELAERSRESGKLPKPAPVMLRSENALTQVRNLAAKKPRRSHGKITYVLAGILVGGLIAAAAMLGRSVGEARRAAQHSTSPR